MKEHPILMNKDMVLALLDNRKHATRRVVKNKKLPMLNVNDKFTTYKYMGYTKDLNVYLFNEYWKKVLVFTHHLKCKYAVGDHLWVRETTMEYKLVRDGKVRKVYGYIYKADNKEVIFQQDGCEPDAHYVTKPSIFMPRSYSRITLEITKIEIQRLNDITNQEAISEGIEVIPALKGYFSEQYHNYIFGDMTGSAIESFSTLWDSINEKRGYGWKSNPFVWVYTFKVIGPEKVGE